MDRKSEWAKRVRDQRKANDLCIVCGNPAGGASRCELCAARRRQQDARRRADGGVNKRRLVSDALCECGRKKSRSDAPACRRCMELDGHASLFAVVQALRATDTAVTLYEIALELGRTPRSVLRTFQNLERRGRLRRVPSRGGGLGYWRFLG